VNQTSVLLINFHSTVNNGDLATLEMNMSQMRQVFQSPRIRVAAQWPEEKYFQNPVGFEPIASAWKLIGFSEKNQAIRQILKYLQAEYFAKSYIAGSHRNIPAHWVKLFDAYHESDVVAAVTGNQMYTTGKFGWPLPIKIFMVNIAHYMNKPLIIMPQSIGPLRWGWEKKLLSKAYGKAKLIFLRDDVSLRLAREINLPQEKIRFAPDPAFDYSPVDSDVAQGIFKRYGFDFDTPAMGMTVIPRYGRSVSQDTMAQYYNELARFLKQFHEETGIRVFLFNQVSGPTVFDDDNIGAQKLLALLKDQPWMTYINERFSPGILKACYGLMDLFLATRMHSGIFSLGMGVPVMFIGYHTKAKGMMQSLGLEQWEIDLENVTFERLYEMGMRAWKEKAEYRQVLAQKIPQVHAEVRQIPQIIRDTLG